MPVLSKRIALDCFYLLIFYFEKFSTDVCRLPCAVNVNLNLSITHGVPQGSILEPLLLSLYMNDLPSVVKFSSVESYVDDTMVYLSF